MAEARIRMGFKPTVKGTVTIDVTVDVSMTDEDAEKRGINLPAMTKNTLLNAIDQFKEAARERGFIPVEAPKDQ